MADGTGKTATGGGTEDKLRAMMRETFEELLGERNKRSSRETETKEQRWLRGVIKEEMDALFAEFAKGYEADDDKKGGGAPAGGGEDDNIITRLFNSGGRS